MACTCVHVYMYIYSVFLGIGEDVFPEETPGQLEMGDEDQV